MRFHFDSETIQQFSHDNYPSPPDSPFQTSSPFYADSYAPQSLPMAYQPTHISQQSPFGSPQLQPVQYVPYQQHYAGAGSEMWVCGSSSVSEYASVKPAGTPASSAYSPEDGYSTHPDLPEGQLSLPSSSTLDIKLKLVYPAPIDNAPELAQSERPQGHEEAGTQNEQEYKVDDSYAKLIHAALLEAPGHVMALQDIYAWVGEKANKGKNDKKWQNSVRHNLSLNTAFEKSDDTGKDRNMPKSAENGSKEKKGLKGRWRLADDILLGARLKTTSGCRPERYGDKCEDCKECEKCKGLKYCIHCKKCEERRNSKDRKLSKRPKKDNPESRARRQAAGRAGGLKSGKQSRARKEKQKAAMISHQQQALLAAQSSRPYRQELDAHQMHAHLQQLSLQQQQQQQACRPHPGAWYAVAPGQQHQYYHDSQYPSYQLRQHQQQSYEQQVHFTAHGLPAAGGSSQPGSPGHAYQAMYPVPTTMSASAATAPVPGFHEQPQQMMAPEYWHGLPVSDQYEVPYGSQYGA